jgi:hypothetical protein
MTITIQPHFNGHNPIVSWGTLVYLYSLSSTHFRFVFKVDQGELLRFKLFLGESPLCWRDRLLLQAGRGESPGRNPVHRRFRPDCITWSPPFTVMYRVIGIWYLIVIVTGHYCTKLPMNCDNFLIYCAPHLNSNHSRFTHHEFSALVVAKREETAWEIAAEFCLSASIIPQGIFNMP